MQRHRNVSFIFRTGRHSTGCLNRSGPTVTGSPGASGPSMYMAIVLPARTDSAFLVNNTSPVFLFRRILSRVVTLNTTGRWHHDVCFPARQGYIGNKMTNGAGYTVHGNSRESERKGKR